MCWLFFSCLHPLSQKQRKDGFPGIFHNYHPKQFLNQGSGRRFCPGPRPKSGLTQWASALYPCLGPCAQKHPALDLKVCCQGPGCLLSPFTCLQTQIFFQIFLNASQGAVLPSSEHQWNDVTSSSSFSLLCRHLLTECKGH